MHKICSIFDVKAQAYSQPMFFQSSGQAVRTFSDEANRTDGNIGAHPEDYTMFCLGEWDEREGKITVYDALKPLARAIDLVERSD